MSNKYAQYKTKEFLTEEYINKRKSTLEIAKEIGSHSSRVTEWLKLVGIKRRTYQEAGKDQINYIDLKFGNWTILREAEKSEITFTKEGRSFHCQCICGTKSIVRINALKRGESKGCGCTKYKGFKDIPGACFSRLIFMAESRGLEFNLTLEQLWDLYIHQNKKCALTGMDIKIVRNYRSEEFTASLDRINSDLGYTLDNVQWVFKDLNKMKTDFEQSLFVKYCKMVASHFP